MAIFLGTLFVVICILLIVVVLLQRGRGGGLGAMFGGAGSSAFGTRTGDVFTWVTIVLTALFLILAIVAGLVWRPAVETVADPVAFPEPQGIREATDVRLLCDTPGARIRYTLDGSEPTQDSKVFQVPIEVAPDTTITFRAFRKGFQPSKIVKARYGLARPAPTVGTTETGPAGESTSKPAVGAEVTTTSAPAEADQPAEGAGAGGAPSPAEGAVED